LESLALAVRFGVSMSAMISPRALNRFNEAVAHAPELLSGKVRGRLVVNVNA
jgi:hypothetical protein